MRNFTDDLAGLRKRLSEAEAYLGIGGKRERLQELEVEMGRPDLWDDQDNARAVTTEYGNASDDVELVDALTGRLDDAEALFEMAREEGDESQEPEIEEEVAALGKELDALELRSLFTGEHDEPDAICEIHAGEGGTDAQDWAEMLLRMYLRWAERRGFDVELDEVSTGRRGRHPRATVHGQGPLRLRPAHAPRTASTAWCASARSTPRASARPLRRLEVTPFLEDLSGEIVIDDKDLRIDTYRSLRRRRPARQRDRLGGPHHPPAHRHRGQLPERAQPAPEQGPGHAGPDGQARRAASARSARPSWTPIRGRQRPRSGSAARSAPTCMQPYQMVKDDRDRARDRQRPGVLDGDLDEFMEAYLRWRRQAEGS